MIVPPGCSALPTTPTASTAPAVPRPGGHLAGDTTRWWAESLGPDVDGDRCTKRNWPHRPGRAARSAKSGHRSVTIRMGAARAATPGTATEGMSGTLTVFRERTADDAEWPASSSAPHQGPASFTTAIDDDFSRISARYAVETVGSTDTGAESAQVRDGDHLSVRRRSRIGLRSGGSSMPPRTDAADSG